MTEPSLIETAMEAARLGGRILKEHLASDAQAEISEKQAFDFVTEVDLLSEKAIMEFIRDRHPGHDILAEESGGEFERDVHRWVIDPLDGTKNYIHSFPMFAVSVAVMYNDKILAGAVLDPMRDELFYAESGGGAFLNGQRIKVSQTKDFSQCLVATGFPFRAKHLTEPYFNAFIGMFHELSDLRRAGSAALDLSYLACGRLDGFWEIGLNLWDIAAGILLIEEAGGRVTGIKSPGEHFENGNIIASNGHVHARISHHVTQAFRDVSF